MAARRDEQQELLDRLDLMLLADQKLLDGLKEEQRQFEAERDRHWSEKRRLDQEVKRLQDEVKVTKDKKKRDELQDEVSLLKAKSQLAESKSEQAECLTYQRVLEQQVRGAWGIEDGIQHWKKRAEEWEDNVKKNEEAVEKLEKREAYTGSKSRLLKALEYGFVKLVMLSCIVMGLPGVGKTHLKFLLLDQEPPHLRTSTNCAEAPVRIEIRTITGTRVQTIGGRWQDVDEEEMFDIVAEMILMVDPESFLDLEQVEEVQSMPKQPEKAKPSKSVFARMRNWVKDMRGTSTTRRSGASIQTSSNVSDACRTALNTIMEKLIDRITKVRSQKNTTDKGPKREGLKWMWVYFNDSGGQPEYHELLPLFVRRISSALCVIRLPDKLDETQDVEYYREGQRVGDVQQSQLTAKDTVRCLANTIQAYSTQDQPPKIMVVGTHLDILEEKMVNSVTSSSKASVGATTANEVETLEEKDRQLREMLEPDFANQLVYYSESSSSKRLIFPLNTRKPGEHDKEAAELIRQRIVESGAKEVKVPIWWNIMEMLLRELARELKRGVLSRNECLEVAQILNIYEKDFDAALIYFDELSLIKYRPDVLPGVVFIDPQIPLNEVSAVVFHNYKLRDPSSAESAHLDEEWRHFRDRGVVTMKCLKHLQRHHFPSIFTENELAKYLQQLLVLAPISNPVPPPSSNQPLVPAASVQPGTATVGQQTTAQATAASDAEERFIMPTLLCTLTVAELKSHRVSSPVAATLLVRFPRGCRRAGVFCCFAVHLVRHCGWDLILDEEQKLYRNFLKMRLLTSPPLTVVLIDSNTYIEVRVNATTGIPVSEYAGLLPVIKNAILSGIFSACTALNYKHTKPHLTFFCPHTLPSKAASPTGEVDGSESKAQHTATLTLDRKYWRCDHDPDNYFGMLEDRHMIWFGLPQAAPQTTSKLADSGRPTMSTKSSSLAEPTWRNLTLVDWKDEQGKKQQFHLKQSICHKWNEIGCLLEIPRPVLIGWEEQYRGHAINSTNAVLDHWFEKPTEFYPLTWEGLDHLLNDAELGQVAEDLKQALDNASH